MSSRRDFLKQSGLCVMAGAAGYLSTEQYLRAADLSGQITFTPGAGPVADPAKKADRPQAPTIVTIFLRGGADMLNTFVPSGDDLYYRLRPRIAMPMKGKNERMTALPIKGDKYWGVNPGMASLLPLIESGMAVPIFNAGSPDGTRSHFSAQDYMERGAPGDTLVSSGWLNRYLEATKKSTDAPLRGLSAQTLVPRALRGPYPVLAGNNRTSEMALFEELYNQQNMVNMTERTGAAPEKGSRLDDKIIRPGRTTIARQLTSDETRDIITQSGAAAVERIKALESASMLPNDAEYPSGGLASQLMAIARVIKANVGLEVAQADFGGWDVHSDAGGANGGRMFALTEHLSKCIVAFTQDLGKRMDKVLVLVMTEFGRTVHENGASGVDHGRAGYMLAVGNMVNGGKFYGTWNGLADLDGGRFLPVHTDFRAVMAESLVKMYKIDPFALGIFPGYKPTAQSYLNYLQQIKGEA